MANILRSRNDAEFWEMCQLMGLLMDRYPGFILNPKSSDRENRLEFTFWNGQAVDMILKGSKLDIFLNNEPSPILPSPSQLIEDRLKDFLDQNPHLRAKPGASHPFKRY